MRPFLLLLFILFYSIQSRAGRVHGIITDEKGHVLPFASVLVKGTPIGTTANNEGKYFLQLNAGKYIIVAQYVGYQRQEKEITIGEGEIQLDFKLSLQNLSLKEVVVRPGAEDPAYEIIRNAIKKREYYLNQLSRFQCEVYTKGIFKLRDYPKKFFGQEVDFEDGDTGKKKILYLSETVSKYSVDKPNKVKIEVLSTKVSGESGGFGFSAPQIISFYENNLQIGSGLSSRGFISPIANNAMNFYRYKYEGSFFEDGKEINRIKVTPKRKYEPLFSGYIQITEGDWRIHSLQLQLTKESQMQLVDTLRIEQLFVPYEKDIWVIKTQVIYPAIKMFGFDAYGNFVNVYSNFDTDPLFARKFFNNTILKYTDSSNKKPTVYWDSVRPLPLLTEEINDYRKKDSLEQLRKSPGYLDSLDRKRNKVSVAGILFTGESFSRSRSRSSFQIDPLISSVQFNTVEGWVTNLRVAWFKRLDSLPGSRRSISIAPTIRYGFSNGHLNSSVSVGYNTGKKFPYAISAAGGKRVFQFNNANPITPFLNTLSTLFYERNYMKIYEAWYGRVNVSKTVTEGVNVSAGLQYQDRMPLENTTDYTFKDSETREFSPNFPQELMSENFKRHQSFTLSAAVSWRPGNKYVEFPDNKFSVGSKYPTFSLSVLKGVNKLFGSDVDYAKWRFRINDVVNLKLFGSLRYNIVAGGFLRTDSVPVIDYTHFNGNQVALASPYLSSFQLLPYYTYSNTASNYYQLNVEHHFNGMLTNKIPGFRTLNWHLVGGFNGFYVNQSKNYIEPFIGLENILRIIRLDLYWGIAHGQPTTSGFRIAIVGITDQISND